VNLKGSNHGTSKLGHSSRHDRTPYSHFFMTSYDSSVRGIPSSRGQIVLVVEDDQTIRDSIEEFLQEEGYRVLTAADGNGAIGILENFPGMLSPSSVPTIDGSSGGSSEPTPIGLIVLDMMLPGINGIDLCQYLRRKGNQVPILMISAKSQEADRVLGLEMGADDYLVKPFGLPELRARCRALIRRTQPPSAATELEETLEYKDIVLYPQQYRVLVKGEEVSLSRKEFALLLLFMQNPKRVFSRDLLIDRVWGADFMGDTKTVDVHIRWLRSKIEEEPSQPAYLLTIRGFGYRFG
jgi:two-component system, OmpR family, phosphate regulon response regulator PhoB